jgi:seryl-tRNA synthetase
MDARAKMAEVRELPDKIKDAEIKLAELQSKCRTLLMSLPNLLHPDVPVGKDESENVELRRWGKPPNFGFTPKSHMDLLRDLELIDEERAGKIAGRGFFYLRGPLVILDMAIQRFALDFLSKKGFVLIEPPFMMRRKPYEGMVDLADFENVMYKIDGEDLYLIATAEHPLGAMYMNEVFLREELPLKMAGVSPCFRKEIGSHGKYTKGLFRMHQFNKVEQFVFCLPEQSWEIHEELQQNCEQLYQALELHYRVMAVCTGDIGSIAAKKYDTEVWMADGVFREIGSNSNCTDYQARRLGIKWREEEGKSPAGFVHTLNNTALATSRTMLAIIEQHQKADGSIGIPRALWPYTGFKEITKDWKSS